MELNMENICEIICELTFCFLLEGCGLEPCWSYTRNRLEGVLSVERGRPGMVK